MKKKQNRQVYHTFCSRFLLALSFSFGVVVLCFGWSKRGCVCGAVAGDTPELYSESTTTGDGTHCTEQVTNGVPGHRCEDVIGPDSHRIVVWVDVRALRVERIPLDFHE